MWTLGPARVASCHARLSCETRAAPCSIQPTQLTIESMGSCSWQPARAPARLATALSHAAMVVVRTVHTTAQGDPPRRLVGLQHVEPCRLTFLWQPQPARRPAQVLPTAMCIQNEYQAHLVLRDSGSDVRKRLMASAMLPVPPAATLPLLRPPANNALAAIFPLPCGSARTSRVLPTCSS